MSARTLVDVAMTTQHTCEKNVRFAGPPPHTINKSVQGLLYQPVCDLCMIKKEHTKIPKCNRQLFEPTDLPVSSQERDPLKICTMACTCRTLYR